MGLRREIARRDVRPVRGGAQDKANPDRPNAHGRKEKDAAMRGIAPFGKLRIFDGRSKQRP
jgi:hypothetical protein